MATPFDANDGAKFTGWITSAGLLAKGLWDRQSVHGRLKAVEEDIRLMRTEGGKTREDVAFIRGLLEKPKKKR